MPTKVLRKILDEFKQSDDESLSIIDQGIVNILEIPELSKSVNKWKFFCAVKEIQTYLTFSNLKSFLKASY